MSEGDVKITITSDATPAIKEFEKFTETVEKASKISANLPWAKNLRKELSGAKADVTRIVNKINDIFADNTFPAEVKKQADAVLDAWRVWEKAKSPKSGDEYAALSKAKAALTRAENAAGIDHTLGDSIKDFIKLKDVATAKANELLNKELEVNRAEKEATAQAQAQADAAQQTADNEANAAKSAEDLAGAEKETAENVENVNGALDETSDKIDDAKNKAEDLTETIGDVKPDAGELPQEELVVNLDTNADVTSMSVLQLIAYIKHLKAEMRDLEKVDDPTQEQSQRYDELSNAVQRATDQLRQLKQESVTAAQMMDAMNGAIQGLANAKGPLSGVLSVLQSFGPVMQQAGIIAETTLATVTSGLSLAITAITTLANIVQSAIERIKRAITSILSAAKRVIEFVIDGIKRVINAISSLVSKISGSLKKAIEKVGGSADKAFSMKNLKRTLQMLTKYIFGFRSFFFLYRRLRKYIGEGIENLVQFQSATNETNTAISELKTSLLYLKNAWAAAFAPIINYVYPVLVMLIDLLASVGNTIARFFAALTGAETVLQAVKVDAGDYADSLKTAGGSAKKAADEQEKLNDRLAAFDDLNVLGVDKDTDPNSGGGGGGGGLGDDIDPNEMFRRIETPVNRLADLIREAWKTGDAFDLGDYFAKALEKGLYHAHEWLIGEGREQILKIGNLIGTFFDGVLSHTHLGEKIGQVLADAFNLGLDFVNTIITPDRMYKVGWQIAEALNEAIPRILPKLGETFGNLFRSAISDAWGFITHADFAEWGRGLSDAINTFMEEMSGRASEGVKGTLSGWQLLGMSVTEFSEQILDFFISAIEGVNWSEISLAIQQFLEGLDWESIKAKLRVLWKTIWTALEEFAPDSTELFENVRGIFEGVLDVLGSIKDAIAQIKWESVTKSIQGLIEWVANANWKEIGDNIGRVISTIGQAIPKIAEFISGIPEKVADIKSFIKDFLMSPDFINAIATIRGEFETVSTALQNIYDVINSLIGLISSLTGVEMPEFSFIETIKSLGQLSIGSSLPNEIKIIIDMFNMLKSLWSNFDGIIDNVTNFVNKVSDDFSSLGFNLSDAVGVVTGAWTLLTQGFGALISSFGLKQPELRAIFDIIIADFGDWDTLKEDFSEIVDTMLEKVDTFVQGFLDIPGALGGLVGLFRGVFNDVIDYINGFFDSVVNARNALVTTMSSMGGLSGAAAAFAGSGTISIAHIPHLAQGAVIPPNREFMAVLGDQSSGTNIEAPLDTIKQAVGEEFAPYAEAIVEAVMQVVNAVNNKELKIGDKEIGRANDRYNTQRSIIRGTML